MRFQLEVFALAVAISTSALGGGHEHREHEAHSHGSANLAIAFEKNAGKIEFKAAAFGVLGFEAMANNEIQKKILQGAQTEFEKKISSWISLAPELKCQFKKIKIDQVAEKATNAREERGNSHSDFVASFDIQCSKSPKGTVLGLNFTELKGLHDIDVTILVDDVQKSVELKGKIEKVDLK